MLFEFAKTEFKQSTLVASHNYRKIIEKKLLQHSYYEQEAPLPRRAQRVRRA